VLLHTLWCAPLLTTREGRVRVQLSKLQACDEDPALMVDHVSFFVPVYGRASEHPADTPEDGE